MLEKVLLVGLFFVVLVVYPAAALLIRRKRLELCAKDPNKEPPPERALGLPNGSTRAMLALLTVGAFVLVLLFHKDQHFTEVVTAFGTLTGSMIGFYFGTRAVQKKGDIPEK